MYTFVCHSFLLRRFKQIDIFKMDLGSSIRQNEMVNTDKYKTTGSGGINIKDEQIGRAHV